MSLSQILCLIVFALVSNSALSNGGNKVSEFKSKVRRNLNIYTKMEESGCITRVSYRNNSSLMRFTYDARCKVSFSELDTVESISQTVVEIIKHFHLETELRKRKYISIYLIWKVSNWPIIYYVNQDSSWPVNYKEEYFGVNSPETNEKYRTTLRNLIIKSGIYMPFEGIMSDLGCRIHLLDYFAEHLTSKHGFIHKDSLIELGVLSQLDAKKDVYPYIAGSITFNYICEEN